MASGKLFRRWSSTPKPGEFVWIRYAGNVSCGRLIHCMPELNMFTVRPNDDGLTRLVTRGIEDILPIPEDHSPVTPPQEDEWEKEELTSTKAPYLFYPHGIDSTTPFHSPLYIDPGDGSLRGQTALDESVSTSTGDCLDLGVGRPSQPSYSAMLSTSPVSFTISPPVMGQHSAFGETSLEEEDEEEILMGPIQQATSPRMEPLPRIRHATEPAPLQYPQRQQSDSGCLSCDQGVDCRTRSPWRPRTGHMEQVAYSPELTTESSDVPVSSNSAPMVATAIQIIRQWIESLAVSYQHEQHQTQPSRSRTKPDDTQGILNEVLKLLVLLNAQDQSSLTDPAIVTSTAQLQQLPIPNRMDALTTALVSSPTLSCEEKCVYCDCCGTSVAMATTPHHASSYTMTTMTDNLERSIMDEDEQSSSLPIIGDGSSDPASVAEQDFEEPSQMDAVVDGGSYSWPTSGGDWRLPTDSYVSDRYSCTPTSPPPTSLTRTLCQLSVDQGSSSVPNTTLLDALSATHAADIPQTGQSLDLTGLLQKLSSILLSFAEESLHQRTVSEAGGFAVASSSDNSIDGGGRCMNLDIPITTTTTTNSTMTMSHQRTGSYPTSSGDLMDAEGPMHQYGNQEPQRSDDRFGLRNISSSTLFTPDSRITDSTRSSHVDSVIRHNRLLAYSTIRDPTASTTGVSTAADISSTPTMVSTKSKYFHPRHFSTSDLVSPVPRKQRTLSESHTPCRNTAHSLGGSARSDVRKCRKVYGIEHRDQWCNQCRWKKACRRFPDTSTMSATRTTTGAASTITTTITPTTTDGFRLTLAPSTLAGPPLTMDPGLIVSTDRTMTCPEPTRSPARSLN